MIVTEMFDGWRPTVWLPWAATLPPLLAALIERTESDWLCEGAHHVCHVLVRKRRFGPVLRPLLAALEQSEPETAAPLAAYNALSKLRDLLPDTAKSVGSKSRKP